MYHKRVSIIIIGLWRVLGLGAEVFGASSELCSNGGQYELGGCCGDGVVNGPSGVEECDNGIWNGTPVSFTMSRSCKSDCAYFQGPLRHFNPGNNTVVEYSDGMGNGAVSCSATSSCPSFTAGGDCKELWQLDLGGNFCCADGSWKNVVGGCPAPPPPSKSTYTCNNGTWDKGGSCNTTSDCASNSSHNTSLCCAATSRSTKDFSS